MSQGIIGLEKGLIIHPLYTVPKVIDFPRYRTKCSGENEILYVLISCISFSSLFRVISRKFGLLFGQFKVEFLVTNYQKAI